MVANDFYHAIQWLELGAPRIESARRRRSIRRSITLARLATEERQPYTCDVDFGRHAGPRSACTTGAFAALEALRDFDLGIWSVHEVPPSLRPFYRGPALGEEMLRITRAATIAVNPHGDFMRYGGNMRLFEACGVGAFQIVDDRPGVRGWFTVGEHLVTYRDPDHLRELVAYYLAHDDERAAHRGRQGRRTSMRTTPMITAWRG